MNRLESAVHVCILLTFALAPMWLKWSIAPAPFTGNYVLGFVVVVPMVASIILWSIAGFPNRKALFVTGWHRTWLFSLIGLVIWGVVSQVWAFGGDEYPGMGQTAALQLILVSGFAMVVICHPTMQTKITTVLILSLLVHGSIGQLQVIMQSHIGLGWLGEFSLKPEQIGISILESNGIRWLRPYGLLPHPNVLAGFLTLGLFAAAQWVMASDWRRPVGIVAFLIGFWFLLLTFSRGAWLGFAVGMLVAISLLHRLEGIWRKIRPVAIGTVIVGIIFVIMYQPLLLSRVGVGQQNTELRSIADRVVYNQIAWDAIQTYPIQGVGIGNYPWYASHYLFYRTDYDLRGADVHNIYLGLLADLGIVGFILFIGMIVSGIGAVLQERTVLHVALLSAFISWGVIGLVDHYMWTMVLAQGVWIAILAAAMTRPPAEASVRMA